MGSSLLNIVNNFSEGILKIKSKYGHNYKNCEFCKIKYKYYDCLLEYTSFKEDLIKYKCLCCNKNYQQKFYEKFKEWFWNTCRFSKHDSNKFILLLRKSVRYECMDDWEKLNEKSLPKEEDFYSHLNTEDIVKILKQNILENIMICMFEVIYYS